MIKLLWNDRERRFLVTTYELGNRKIPATGESAGASSKPASGPGEAASPSGISTEIIDQNQGRVKEKSGIESTSGAPALTPEQQRRMDELRQGIEKMRQREAPSWAESVAAKLEAQAAELTKGHNVLPRGGKGTRSDRATDVRESANRLSWRCD